MARRCTLVDGEIVEPDRLPRLSGGHQDPLANELEGLAIEGARKRAPWSQPGRGERGNQRHRGPAAARDAAKRPLTPARPCPQRGERRRRAGRIEKAERRRISGRHHRAPCGPCHRILCSGNQGLFLRVNPRSRSQRLMVERAGRTPARAAHCAQWSAKVAAGAAATCAASAGIWAAASKRGRPDRGRANPEPVRVRCRTQREIVDGSFPKTMAPSATR